MRTLDVVPLVVVCAAGLARPALAAPEPTGRASAAPAARAVPVSVDDDDSYADTDPSALSDFHATLDPYGVWIDDPTYGTVWVPSVTVVGSDFTPYLTAGHWTYEDGDYVWVSDYPWGWAPFHYGRWVWISGTGWAWVPGRVYAGAWVDWSVGVPGYPYVGWAPMPPRWIWRRGAPVTLVRVPSESFVFFPRERILAPDLVRYVVPAPRVVAIRPHMRPYVRVVRVPGGRQPIPRGPLPRVIGIEVPRAPAVSDSGVVRARRFARPSTALPLGARPPARVIIRRTTPPVMRPRVPARPLGRPTR